MSGGVVSNTVWRWCLRVGVFLACWRVWWPGRVRVWSGWWRVSLLLWWPGWGLVRVFVIGARVWVLVWLGGCVFRGFGCSRVLASFLFLVVVFCLFG